MVISVYPITNINDIMLSVPIPVEERDKQNQYLG